MRGHVDAESLALCAEGLLSRRRSERIRAHVLTCPECAAAQARLSGVPARLAQVPAPSLPPGIAARLDAALSAETAHRAAQAPGQAPDLAPDAVPGPRAPRRRGFPVAARVLAVAGVLVVAGGVGYVVTQSSPSTEGSSSSAAGSAAGPAHSTAAGPDVRAPAALGTTTFAVTHSGTRYRPHTFPAQAAGVLSHSSTGLIRPGSQPGQSRRSDPALSGCVTKVVGADRAGEVKLVDRARYRGHPATVIAVAATSTEPARVYVAGARCSATDADILAQARLR